MEFRSYFQFSFRIIFRVCTTFVPRKKKKTSPLKNRHHNKPLRRCCLKTQNHQKVQWKMLALEALQVPRFCQFQDFLRWHNLDLVDVVFFDRKKSGFSDGMVSHLPREDMSVIAIYHCGYVLFCFRTCTFCCKVAGIHYYTLNTVISIFISHSFIRHLAQTWKHEYFHFN